MSKILVIAPSWIGDTVLAQPLFRRLHEQEKNLILDVLAPSWTLPVLQCMPEVHETLCNPFGHGEIKLRARWRFAKNLEQRAYDHAIVLPNSWKSALIPFFAGIPKRTGYIGEMRWGLLTHRYRLDKAILPLMVQRFTALAGGDLSPTAHPTLTLPNELRLATLKKFNLGDAKPIAALCIGAEYGPAKRWPEKHFAALARQLGDRGYRCILVGSAKDIGVANTIHQLSDGVGENFCGKTNLSEAIALLASSQLIVSNDSGLMHIGAALNRPLLALFGSSSPAFTPPLSDKAVTLSLQLACSPCYQRVCPLGHFNCMENMTPALVMDKITH